MQSARVTCQERVGGRAGTAVPKGTVCELPNPPIFSCLCTPELSAKHSRSGSREPDAGCPSGIAGCRVGASQDRKSTRLNSSHGYISYAVFCLKKKKTTNMTYYVDNRHTIERVIV